MFKNLNENKNTKFVLPTTKSVISTNLFDYSILCYGRKKIGKTSLFSQVDKNLFFLFEAGAKAQSVYKVPTNGDCFTSWDDVESYLKQLKSNKFFNSVTIDTGKPAYDLCLEAYCQENNITHPSKAKDFGASWAGVNKQFKNAHLHIAGAGMGLMVLAHEKVETFTAGDGKEYERTTMAFSPALNEFYEGIIDIIMHYGYIGKERFLTIRGNEFLTAGIRLEGNFLTPRGAEIYSDYLKGKNKFVSEIGKEQIEKIPCGTSSAETYKNLLKAFNNEQTETYKDVDTGAKYSTEKDEDNLENKTISKKFKFKSKK
jgi:hypothetical protein